MSARRQLQRATQRVRLEQLEEALEQADKIGAWLQLFGENREDATIAGRDLRQLAADALRRRGPDYSSVQVEGVVNAPGGAESANARPPDAVGSPEATFVDV